MSYATLLVHLELGRSNEQLLRVAGDLSEQFDAKVIGLAACSPMPVMYGDTCVSGDVYAMERDEIDRQLKAAEAEFRDALRARGCALDWRSAEQLGDLATYIAHQARSADLIVTGVAQGDAFDSSRALNAGALIMQAGRPVIVVPANVRALQVKRVVVAWKDTRETRRAVVDALPLMKKAAEVTVVEIAAEGHMEAARRHLDDLVTWLKRHGVEARALAAPSTGDDVDDLREVADRERCDVLVAGAWGHSRMREWMLGGVTRDLLLRSQRCTLLSH